MSLSTGNMAAHASTESDRYLGPLFDSDNHYYEPRDCFTRHIEKKYEADAIRVVQDNKGRDRLVLGGNFLNYLTPVLFDEVPAPGGLSEVLRGQRADTGERPFYPMQPEYQNRDARLKWMDREGVEGCIMLPGVGVCVEHPMRAMPEVTFANLRAFNRWLEEDWGFAWQNRLFAPPLLSLVDLEMAVAELRSVVDRGARLVHLLVGPVNGRNPADPYFDPFWGLVNETGVVVCYHISDSGYNELFSAAWGEKPTPPCHFQSAFQWAVFHGDRPIMDTVAALVLGNLFGRFPGIRIATIENGASWVPYLMKRLDKSRQMGRPGPWIGGPLKEKPSEIMKRHVFVSPFHEEDHGAIIESIGVDQIIFGSDWPHPEGLVHPGDYRESLPQGLGPEVEAKILAGNAHRMIGLEASC